MKIGILGAGAVGAYLVLGLSEKFGDDLRVIASGERAERLKTDGLEINGKRYELNVQTPKEASGLDVLFVCLKYNALRAALGDIRDVVGKDTLVVSLMNGVDSEEIIGEAIGEEHIVYSLIKISSTRNGNDIRFPLPKGKTGIYLGMPGKKAAEEKNVMKIARIFDDTPIIVHLSDDILRDIWDKFGLNISRNLPQAILDVGAGAYDDSEHVDNLKKKLRQEVVTVAQAKGIGISEAMMPGYYTPAQRYSTLQDLDAKRETEIEMFSGALIRIGKELGIPCPYNEVVYDLIKALEEKNRGKFDYEL
ncbi:MAG: ketopantoate reductase family protein [Spirochaetales bacterium]|nr:ketopantoate reductase family protein [Spirochaetales bacterium]